MFSTVMSNDNSSIRRNYVPYTIVVVTTFYATTNSAQVLIDFFMFGQMIGRKKSPNTTAYKG